MPVLEPLHLTLRTGLHVGQQTGHTLGGGLEAQVPGTGQALGGGVDADHPHRLDPGAAQRLVEQVRADVAGADEGGLQPRGGGRHGNSSLALAGAGIDKMRKQHALY